IAAVRDPESSAAPRSCGSPASPPLFSDSLQPPISRRWPRAQNADAKPKPPPAPPAAPPRTKSSTETKSALSKPAPSSQSQPSIPLPRQTPTPAPAATKPPHTPPAPQITEPPAARSLVTSDAANPLEPSSHNWSHSPPRRESFD